MKKYILKQLRILNQHYQSIGFHIVGVFGSYARGDEKPSSDLDLVYEIQPSFTEKFGWSGVMKLEEIKQEIKQELGVDKVDLAPKNTMNKTLRNVLKKELVYV